MTRPMHSDTRDALSARAVPWSILVELDLGAGGVARLWAGRGDLDWNGDVFTGAGDFAAISKVEESADGVIDRVNYGLTGIDDELAQTVLSDLLDSDFQGRVIRCWLVIFEPDSMTIRGEPIALRQDIMRTISTIDRTGGTEATLEAYTPTAPNGTTGGRVYSDADQQAEFPGDDFLRNVEAVGVKPLILG